MKIGFANLFKAAMGEGIAPYPYQTKLAEGSWPDIINIPTGMGKTASVILGWIFKRLQNDPDTYRRLIYCLPMRVLVEQTAQNARYWIRNLIDSDIIPQGKCPSVYVLMGGEIDADWDRYPEQDTVLIGTQDQLLSRALNRGYAMSRFRWPVQFGLLNNDCMWVMDEIQLMGTGLATTTQLQAFRDILGTVFPTRSIWMSATLQKDWLNTIDFALKNKDLQEVELSEEDKQHPNVNRRIGAKKALLKAKCPADNPQKIAGAILEAHQNGKLTLIVVNTVKRATEIYKAVKDKNTNAALTIIHSRFRPADRQNALEKLLAVPGKDGSICISTQVVEAGVDVSANTLFTDLAPWSSLVQRFGRCNRLGLDDKAKVIWFDLDLSKKGSELPYMEKELRRASSILHDLDDVAPGNLPSVSSRVDYDHVVRQKDIIELFDTTPDLSGMDIDISRFIRESDVHDVQVFWREIPKEGPLEKESSPSREELCSVPVKELKAINSLEMWRWDHLEKRWIRPISISPGMTLMLRRMDGRYSSEIGWTGNKADTPEYVQIGRQNEEANDDDRYVSSRWQTLAEHNLMVLKEVKDILSKCELPEEGWIEALKLAAFWHDAGKAHNIFQSAMVGNPPEADMSVVWAKTNLKNVIYERKGFRHELASALAILINKQSDLIAYLAAAHHGKVRLSIRSLPHEKSPADPSVRFARGIWDGDVLREVNLGEGYKLPQTNLDLSYMEFGDGPRGPSWLSRMLTLRDDPSLGPFRLAYLEALLRAADWRASEKAEEKDA